MKRIHILSIGRDSSVTEIGSQLHTRFMLYDSYHTFTHVVMNQGERKEIKIGQSTIIVAGGKTLLGAFLRCLREIWKQATRDSFVLVTTQDVLYAGLVGYLVSRRFKLPLYVQVHGDHLDNERWYKSKVGKFNRVMNVVGKFILRRADQVRVVSGRLCEQLHANYKIPLERMISIPIGTDLTLFATSGGDERKRRIFFAQRLIHEKCPMLFARVVKAVMDEFPDVTTEIAGDGFLKSEMEEYFKEHNLSNRVIFHGKMDQKDLAALYATSYCYLHTADWEGWGMPMIEAMAAGCPVVTTDTGCAGEAVRHEVTGMVTAINDEDALIRETKRLFVERDLWEQLSNASREEAKTWSFSSLAEKNMQWYADADER